MTPPSYAIESARIAALDSPCAKSKRGVVLFTVGDDLICIAGRGFNGQPSPFTCSGTDVCRRDCAKPNSTSRAV